MEHVDDEKDQGDAAGDEDMYHGKILGAPNYLDKGSNDIMAQFLGGGQGLTKSTDTKDMFAQMFLQEQKKYAEKQEQTIDNKQE